MPGPVDYREALAGLFGVPPDSRLIDGLIARLTPTISTEELFRREQEEAGVRSFRGAADITAAGGQFATVQLTIPPTPA